MKVWQLTDKGPKRPQNQDACYAKVGEGSDWALIAVCDGMGGAKSGNVASSLAINVFTEMVSDGLTQDPIGCQLGELLLNGVTSANDAVFELSLSGAAFHGMGTTLVAALLVKEECAVVNVGDSRAYLIRENGIRQITRDHSLVEELIGRGDLTREEAAEYPGRNLITRAVGTAQEVHADLFFPALAEGEYILLCSDGLTNTVSEQEILFEILHGGESENCCERLIQIAVTRGAPDNVTAVLLKK